MGKTHSKDEDQKFDEVVKRMLNTPPPPKKKSAKKKKPAYLAGFAFMSRQTCKVCGRPDKFDFHVPTHVWQKVVPPQYWNRVVCLYCFDDFAVREGVAYASHLQTLYFAGDQGCFHFRAERALDGPF